jgi:hypothetical protein
LLLYRLSIEGFGKFCGFSKLNSEPKALGSFASIFSRRSNLSACRHAYLT